MGWISSTNLLSVEKCWRFGVPRSQGVLRPELVEASRRVKTLNGVKMLFLSENIWKLKMNYLKL